jgi:hypothetical protein
MRTFQQDTALHFVTERSSIDYVAGGEKTRTALAGLLLQSKDVYERTQSDVGENTVTAFMQESYSQVRCFRFVLETATADTVYAMSLDTLDVGIRRQI